MPQITENSKSDTKPAVKEEKKAVPKRRYNNFSEYIWELFIYLTFILIGFWYYLMYFARIEQQMPSRFHYSRFGFEN